MTGDICQHQADKILTHAMVVNVVVMRNKFLMGVYHAEVYDKSSE